MRGRDAKSFIASFSGSERVICSDSVQKILFLKRIRVTGTFGAYFWAEATVWR